MMPSVTVAVQTPPLHVKAAVPAAPAPLYTHTPLPSVPSKIRNLVKSTLEKIVKFEDDLNPKIGTESSTADSKFQTKDYDESLKKAEGFVEGFSQDDSALKLAKKAIALAKL